MHGKKTFVKRRQIADSRDCAQKQSQYVPTLVIDGANEYLFGQQISQRVVPERDLECRADMN
jgi:hypothetical protein